MSARAAGDKAAPALPARLPWALLTVTVVLVVVMVPLSLGREPLFDTVFYGVLAVALGTTGAFVASRQPANPIGWIFCGLGVLGGVVETWEAFPYHSLPTGELGEWIVGWSWVVNLSAYALVFLLFPTGRLLTSRWRSVVWLLAAGCVVGVPGQALNPANPLPVDSVVIDVMFGLGMLLVHVALIAAVASVVIRYRRAAGVERLQLALSGFTEGSSLAVAASTLAVAALFRPARSRIQAAVDKRFFRRKYDAVRKLEAFGARLRAEVDLASLEGDLRAVVAGTMQPAHVSLWLREGSA